MTLFEADMRRPEVEHDASRPCEWCGGPIPRFARRDAVYCSTRCRQAAHRFKRGAVARDVADRPLRLAYADPPYPGRSKRYYGEHPDFAGEVDLACLVEQLRDGFPDGWALSTSADALQEVLALCPAGARVAVWVRGERPVRARRPLNAWEPVIYHGGRAIERAPEERRTDVLAYTSRARLTDENRVVGSKPAAFCYWLFDLLGALPGDDLVDVFPGSGGVARAWSYYLDAGVRPVAEDLDALLELDFDEAAS